jgi:type IV pilus assembly protein PilV
MQRSPAQRGFSLIEVLIAVLVLALGLLGIAAMQSVALRSSQSSFERSQAVMETYSMLDTMSARGGAQAGTHNTGGFICELPEDDGSGPRIDLRAWMQSLKDTLNPRACGNIECVGDFCLVEVRWDDSRALAIDEDEDLKEYTVQTRSSL